MRIDEKNKMNNFSISKKTYFLTYLYLISGYVLESSKYASIILISLLIMLLFSSANNASKKNFFRLIISSYHLYIFAFFLVCIYSSTYAINENLAVIKSFTILKILISSIILYKCYYNIKDIDPLLKCIMYTGYTLSVIAIIFFGPSMINNVLHSTNARLSNELMNANSLGMSISLSMLINYYFWKKEKFKISYLLIIPSFFVLLASNSRKAIIFVVVGLLLMILLLNFKNRNFFRRSINVLFGLFFASLLLFFISNLTMFSSLSNRFEGLFAAINNDIDKMDHSTMLRYEYINIGMNLFENHKMFGIGIDNTRVIIYSLKGYNHYLHNNYVELLADVGLIGFITYYSMHIFLIFKMIKNLKYSDNQLTLCLIFLLLQLIMDYGMVSYYSKDTYFYLMVFFLQKKIFDEKNKLLIEEKKNMEEDNNEKSF